MTRVPPFSIRAIDHVVLRTEDPERLIKFYTAVVGCSVEKRLRQIPLTQLRAGASLIDILEVAPTGRSCGANMDHFCISVDGWNPAAMARHLGHFGHVVGPVAMRRGALGVGPSVYVQDPDGNTLEIKSTSSPSAEGSRRRGGERDRA